MWIWLIVLLPLLSLIPAFIYLENMRRGMVDLMRLDPFHGSPIDVESFVAAQLGLYLDPWFLVLIPVNWGLLAACVWFAALDARELAHRGFADPFPWLWSLLSLLVYVIGRHVVIRRRGGRGAAPLIATIAIQVATFVASMVWVVVFTMQIVAAVFSRIPVP